MSAAASLAARRGAVQAMLRAHARAVVGAPCCSRHRFNLAAAVVEAPGAGTAGARTFATRRAKRVLPAALNVTESAAARISDLVASKKGAVGIKLGVRTRGCNGLSYTMNYVDEGESVPKLDEVVKQHDVMVVIDGKALFHVIGTTMDWEETALSAEFTFENPNAKGECGCGESFNV